MAIDPWEEAIKEAFASAPANIRVLDTLELQHPTLPTPYYFVNDTQDWDLTLEDSTVQTFTACAFSFQQPDQQPAEPQCQITVDNVSRLLMGPLEAAVKVRASLVVTFRQYSSNILTVPQYTISGFQVNEVQVNGTTVTGMARRSNFVNSKFPGRIYSQDDFQSLTLGID